MLWIIIGYIFALCGGVIAVFIGYSLSSQKEMSPTGDMIYANSDKIRLQGKIIMYLGIATTIFWLLMMRFR